MKRLPLLLPDSNFFIRLFRLRGLPFDVLREEFAAYEIVTCQMVMLEVLCGIAEPRVLANTTRLFESLRCVKMEDSTWALARQLAWERERVGRRLGIPDILIAACALESGAAVLTNDRRFAEIPELSVVSGL